MIDAHIDSSWWGESEPQHTNSLYGVAVLLNITDTPAAAGTARNAGTNAAGDAGTTTEQLQYDMFLQTIDKTNKGWFICQKLLKGRSLAFYKTSNFCMLYWFGSDISKYSDRMLYFRETPIRHL